MNSSERFRATYEFKPVDHLYRREFYIWTEAIERWKKEGMPADADQSRLFGFDEPGDYGIWDLGWCEAPFVPPMVEKIIEEGAEYQIIRDTAGRLVKVFKGRRHGFMPTYVKHAVANDADWENDVAPLLCPTTPQRLEMINGELDKAALAAKEGKFMRQFLVGGYMYLRSLVGPEGICFLFVDNPSLVHKMMQGWLNVADGVIARTQKRFELDELFIAEDICYNHGLLISPDMVREFLFPYYQQLLKSIRSRQKRKLYFQVDTDGNCTEALDLYLSIGLFGMSPFEIAAGNDVVEIARKYPHLLIWGGIDKRVLAQGKDAIDGYLQRVIPFMVKRGGYIPTCDHGVPDNVSFDNYMYYRRRIMELDHA